MSPDSTVPPLDVPALVVVRPFAEASAVQKVGIVAQMLEELGVAQAMATIHGRERGAARYVEAGGRVRLDTDGEVVVFFEGEWWQSA